MKILYKGRKHTLYEGQQFGRLTVIKMCENSKCRQKQCLSVCDCGEITVTRIQLLFNGGAKSCGCLQRHLAAKSMKTHGKSYKRVYISYRGMLARCLNEKAAGYERYGGRGIKICDRWVESFENFLEDMGEPKKGESLDRIDFNGNYEPNNCRWASRKTQANNRRDSVFVEFRGQTKTITEWEADLGFNKNTLHYRLNHGWSVESALTEPVKAGRRGKCAK